MVEYSDLLVGAEIMSLAFSPIQERQLHILDSLGNMRTTEISRRAAENTSISTIIQNEQPLVMSAILWDRSKRLLYSATILPFDDDRRAEVSLWNLDKMDRENSKRHQVSFLRYFSNIRSDNLVIEFDPVLQIGINHSAWNDFPWSAITRKAESVIFDTIGGMKEYVEKLNLTPDESLMDCTPKVSTKVSFDSNCSLGFFMSSIYVPIATSSSRRQWTFSVIMDIRSLTSPKARQTGAWHTATVGAISKEILLTAYHEESRTLAYSISLQYTDKVEEHDTRFAFMSRLLICNLTQQSLWDIDVYQRDFFLISSVYHMGENS
jgi:hypothetical protein